MRRLSLVAMIAIPAVFFVACGDGDGDEEAGSAAGFIEACEKYCEVSLAVDCGSGATIAQCKSGCSIYEEQQRGLCISEQVALFRCAADLEFTCMNEVAVPKTTGCVSETQAASVCQEEAPCQSFCAAAIKAGCGGANEEACVASCKQDALSYGFCRNDQNFLRACQGAKGVTCEGGAPKSAACTENALEVAGCMALDDPCLGHCIAAELAGCGGESREACASECKATLGSLASCQLAYEELLKCDAEEGVSCDGSTAKSSAECSAEQQDFTMCTGGM